MLVFHRQPPAEPSGPPFGSAKVVEYITWMCAIPRSRYHSACETRHRAWFEWASGFLMGLPSHPAHLGISLCHIQPMTLGQGGSDGHRRVSDLKQLRARTGRLGLGGHGNWHGCEQRPSRRDLQRDSHECGQDQGNASFCGFHGNLLHVHPRTLARVDAFTATKSHSANQPTQLVFDGRLPHLLSGEITRRMSPGAKQGADE